MGESRLTPRVNKTKVKLSFSVSSERNVKESKFQFFSNFSCFLASNPYINLFFNVTSVCFSYFLLQM